MQFTTLLVALSSALLASAGAPVQVAYDTNYDTSTLSLASTSCSDGSNGLMTAGYTTLGSLPNFPMVGASAEVPGWNSPQCGKCFKINYKGNNIYVTAVDHAGTGFVLSKAAMDALTGGQATAIGRITTGAAYVQVAQSFCKM